MKNIIGFSLLCLLLSGIFQEVKAQSFRSKNRDPFRNSQGFIGLWGGANFSDVRVLQSFTDFSNIDLSNTDLVQDQKSYGTWTQQAGYQLGLSAAFSFNKLITVVTSPAYKKINYRYNSLFGWMDPENPDNALNYDYGHEHRLYYVSLPLMIRISPAGKRFRPYLQAGAFYDRLLNARKLVSTTGTDRASGAVVDFDLSEQSTGITELLIRSHAGLLAGAGFCYNTGTMLLFLDAQYRMGLHNITHVQNRYSGSRDLYGFGNVLDDISIRNIELSFGCYFPLKFLTKDFSPVIL